MPIDIIPDFIPVLGYADEIVLLPLAIWLALKLIPPQILAEHSVAVAAAAAMTRPVSRVGDAVVVCLWTSATLLPLWLLWPHLAER